MVLDIPRDSTGSFVVSRSRLDELASRGRYLTVFAMVRHEYLFFRHAERDFGNVVVRVFARVPVVAHDQFLQLTAAM